MQEQYWQAIYQSDEWQLSCLKEQAEEVSELLYNARVSKLQKRLEEEACKG